MEPYETLNDTYEGGCMKIVIYGNYKSLSVLGNPLVAYQLTARTPRNDIQVIRPDPHFETQFCSLSVDLFIVTKKDLEEYAN